MNKPKRCERIVQGAACPVKQLVQGMPCFFRSNYVTFGFDGECQNVVNYDLLAALYHEAVRRGKIVEQLGCAECGVQMNEPKEWPCEHIRREKNDTSEWVYGSYHLQVVESAWDYCPICSATRPETPVEPSGHGAYA